LRDKKFIKKRLEKIEKLYPELARNCKFSVKWPIIVEEGDPMNCDNDVLDLINFGKDIVKNLHDMDLVRD
jgi:hypothetical protein